MPKPESKPEKPVKPDKGSIDATKPSEKIDQKEKKDKEVKTKAKTEKLGNLLNATDVPTTGQVTAGNWVADFDNVNIRKNTLRIGDR